MNSAKDLGADLKARLAEKAKSLGFSQCAVTALDGDWPHADRLRRFIASGFHGEMSWMAETLERRQHPAAMWDQAKSAIVLGLDYPPEDDPLLALERTAKGVISAYAQNEDYHDLIKPRLKQIAAWLQTETQSDVKVFVDTAPLMEKPLAQAAGLGWIGKQTVLISRRGGAWMFLGVILTSAALPPDAPEADHCGQCTKCVDICPTNAFPAPYQLDARRCISYLTIEHKGVIAPEFRAAMGNRIYGCDDCLAICPWNKFAASAREAKLQARPDLKDLDLADLARLDDASFRALFRKSPVKRIGRDRFIRNVMIAIGNSGSQALASVAEDGLEDAAPQVRAMAVWALRRLAPARASALAPERLARERDVDVRGEWAGLG